MLRTVRIVLAVTLAVAAWATADEPYKRMFDDTLVFTGTETLPSGTGVDGEVVIGLFAPDDDEHPVGRAITRGAMLAVDQANASGGIGGRPIRLVRRWADDPWGAGANEVVKLVFEDHAWALIGGPDGATTHIAQQVVTKAHIPLIAPVSSDPSLTQTRVPWIFRLAPDDTSQAALLVNSGVLPRGLERIGLVTSTDHDGRTAAAELTAALERAGTPIAFHIELTSNTADPSAIASRIAAFKPDGLVIRVARIDVRPLIDALGRAGLGIPLFLPWIPGLDLRQFPPPFTGELISVAPFETPRNCGAYLKLVRAHIARYGETPTPAVVYGYDSARLVIEAMGAGPSGRIELQRLLTTTPSIPMASGRVSWDTGGGNTAAAHLEE